MPFFIRDFFNNPAGKGATFLNIKATKDQFNIRYEKIVKSILCSSYLIKNEVYLHLRIPSSVQGIYYDVVLGFTPSKTSVGNSIEDMEMKIFSNSPSFLYTYAYAYQRQGLFLDTLKHKLSPKMINDISKSKNPYGILSYDYSVYCALNYIIVNGYLTINSIEAIKEGTSFSGLYKNVKNADVLQKERGMQKDFNSYVAKEQKRIMKNAVKNVNSTSVNSSDSVIKNVKNTTSSSSNKQTKKVKRL